MAERGLVVWWSTNTRCAAVLARSAVAAGVPTLLVVDPTAPAPPPDLLLATEHLDRPRAPLTLPELGPLVAAARTAMAVDTVVLAPTSEYLLDTLHVELAGRWPAGLVVPGTSTVGYRHLSGKHWGAAWFAGRPDLGAPADGVAVTARLPFVAKPRVNVVQGRVLKPFVVDDADSLVAFHAEPGLWFAQEFVPAPSVYWCAYRSRDGVVTDTFSRNLLQRPGGDSIVLAVAEEPEKAAALRPVLRGFLDEAGFVGPAMVELRGDPPRFIEINPRFWGPLLLDVLTGGAIVDAFLRDTFGVPFTPWLDHATLARARAYVVPSALSEELVALGTGTQRPTRLDPTAQQVLLDLAGFDPTTLGGAW